MSSRVIDGQTMQSAGIGGHRGRRHRARNSLMPAAAAMNHESEWLTTRAIADELGVEIGTVRRWIHSGKLPAKGTPGLHLVHRDDLTAFLTRFGHTAPATATEGEG